MSPPAESAGLAPLDIVGLVLVGLLMLLGLWRGLWWQVIRLVGLLAAVLLARTFAPDFAAWILGRWTELSPRLAHGIAWFSVFLGALLVATLLGLFGHQLLAAMKLGPLDRLGGGLLGAASGLLLHVAVLVALCQIAPEPFVGRVVAGTYSERVVRTVGDRWEVVLQGDAARELERLLGTEPPSPQDHPGDAFVDGDASVEGAAFVDGDAAGGGAPPVDEVSEPESAPRPPDRGP